VEILIEEAVSSVRVFGSSWIYISSVEREKFIINLFLVQFYFWMTAVLGKVPKLSRVRERVKIRFCFLLLHVIFPRVKM